MSTAIVFPGMGPQVFADVGKFLLINPVAREMAGQASDTVGYNVIDRYRVSESDYSEAAQVAFLVTCLALARWAEENLGMAARFCAGPSFGGKAAATYSGSLTFRDAVWLTAKLSEYETRFFTEDLPGIVTHSFARTPRESLKEILAELDDWHEISCHIDHDFYMVSLREERLDWLQRRIRAAGGLPLYTMDPPMHSSTFAPLRDRVETDLFGELEFADPVIPVVADQDGSVRKTGDGVRTMLLDGFVRAVQWPEVVDTLLGLDVQTVYVSGQDSLFGRVPCTTRNFDVTPVDLRLAMRPPRPTR
ncbi:ACP S-malonyltransferase [Kibdelosporangium persicum]|uniref:[acyl-carrier-protein] S-malonyltransferase n=1 Tax=Kibdelosporangium persicum TaxID=2698649 RepID=A0ABX2F5W8_9PSEU|nr:ACP S-malonyltransferase [Kibdelosporangium persicum]NRN66554.1 Amalonyl CoA-acyl carrier protein transacylase [Kibdelosporangium persicum]